MKNLLALVLLFAFLQAKSQHFNTSRSMGMGDLATVFTDQNSLFGNQAGLATVNENAIIAGLERRLWWDDVNAVSLGYALPTTSGTFGLSLHSFGFSDFQQQKIGLAYARKIWQAIRMSGQIDFFRFAIPEYGSINSFSFEIGLQADLAENFLIGAHISNPYQIELADGEDLATVFQMGVLYKPSKIVAFGMELKKDIDFPLQLKGGIEYLPIEKLAIRAGYSSDPSNFHFGLGFKINNKFMIDMGNQYDLSLGLASNLFLGYTF